ncbi:glycosyltransferase [Kutzneria buriramensis]|uniref:Vancomycin aglycone glucosyltransferase n=1 Tax=Kutzneria buriramensis TaxID=1045776 RepID=A0A3E0I5T7_9PSEU|nr:glycosyltransferase [Kutzneria buriramensis]REH53896.1 vancomycin aglycone glucosyltransferase [Kutzneria buriramensis]
MRVVLSTIGSRGDVQPVVALALRLREMGHEARLCAPPDFRGWIEGLGIEFVPLGPEVRPEVRPDSETRRLAASPEGVKQLVEGTVATQFETLLPAADGCDVVLAWSVLQVAAPSVAEKLGIRHVYATFSPNQLPSGQLAPAPMPGWQQPADVDNRTLWAMESRRWNDIWRPAVNSRRESIGLPPIDDVLTHVNSPRPWLAADPVLGPWPDGSDVVQTGAWLMRDTRPLPADLARFLDAGEPPVFFGFGSTGAAPADIGRTMLAAAREHGRRAMISRGWADLELPDADDALVIDEANFQALFPRVAAVVHHGGSGTTTVTAISGTPHVIVPHRYDQFYWAARVEALGIGVRAAVESLASGLDGALRPEVAAAAKSVAAELVPDGVEIAADLLVN